MWQLYCQKSRSFVVFVCQLAAVALLFAGCDETAPPSAAFSASTLSGMAPLTVTFTDASQAGSSDITTWWWEFGDGATSTAVNPVHTYTEAGTYTVSLVVLSDSGTDSAIKTDYIVVDQLPVAPTADFNAVSTIGYAPFSVQFLDTSDPGTSPITAWLWDFGDGNTSHEADPAHTYEATGTYSVSLTITTDHGSNTESKTEYILVSATPVAPACAFRCDATEGYAPFEVQFEDLTVPGTAPVTSWLWNFGDGRTSSEPNPSHVYSTPGIYSVSLYVTTDDGNDTAVKTDHITVNQMPVGPTCLFESTTRFGYVPLAVQFQDLSTPGTAPITNWLWDFGDGATSANSNPMHTYTTSGTYTVSLTITTAVGSDTKTITNMITAGLEPEDPTCDFTASPISGYAPLSVSFQDLSTPGTFPITTWGWEFGDGNSSGVPNPEHLYTTPGTYTVALTVQTASGDDTESKAAYITVIQPPDPPTAAFSASPSTGQVPLTVAFQDTSDPGTKPITAWLWEFGDGATSTVENPSHTYTTAGTYTVSLSVTSEIGSDTASKPDYISASPESIAPTADFSADQTLGFGPMTVQFSDASASGAAAITSWLWNFGDGSTSTAVNPEHSYTAAGTYTVVLTVTSADGSDSRSRVHYIEVYAPEDPTIWFSHQRGFYTESFDLMLSSAAGDAVIRYTLDGSEPAANHGTFYTGPITITSTTLVRALAVDATLGSSKVKTHTYLFLDDIVQQSPNGTAPFPGWPTAPVNNQVFDYGMDPDVVNDPVYAPLMVDALQSVPTLSIVTDLDNLFDPAIGIFVNAREDGELWERVASLEMIDPVNEDDFQVNMGLRIRGGWSRRPDNAKHSFRMFFRGEYGDSKLRYPLFGEEGDDEFDKLDLRCSQDYSWTIGDRDGEGYGDLNTMNRDVFSRDTQRDMGQPYTRSRYYHLYLNGAYWGLYQSQERSEADFAESYLGGDKEEYDVIKRNSEVVDGNADAWTAFWLAYLNGFISDESYYAVQGCDPDGTPNPAVTKLLDQDNLIDYMLAIYYGGNFDSPISWWWRPDNSGVNNIWCIFNRVNPDGFKFFTHDSEHTLLAHLTGYPSFPWSVDRTGPHWHPNLDTYQYFNPQSLHQKLTAHPEYRMRFADRVQKHFFGNGALTPTSARARFVSRTDELELPIIGDSARWGDSSEDVPRTRDVEWRNTTDAIRDQFFPMRTAQVLEQFRTQGWYPAIDAPVYNHFGGAVASGFSLTMTNPNAQGTLYYTTDGSDPRQPASAWGTYLVRESAAKRALVPTSAPNSAWHTDPAYDDSAWIAGSGYVGYEADTGYENFIDLDVLTPMHNQNTTCLIRIPFTVDGGDLPWLDTLLLRIRYEDGFVAYLNGTPIAEAFAPASLDWNASATGQRDDDIAVQPETFDVTAHLGALQAGANVLAIHGLNISLISSDFLISTELIATSDTAGEAIDPGASDYQGPLSLTRTTRIKARVLGDDGTWSALTEALFTVGDLVNTLRITEIMYHPQDPPEGNPDAEFIELQNIGAEPINLQGVAFTDGIYFEFPDITVQPGAYIVVVRDPVAYELVYGTGTPIAGTYTGKLSNGGERICLVDATGATLFDFTYEDNWYPTTDGEGYSLALIDPIGVDPADLGDVSSWRPSVNREGSPGTIDPGTIQQPDSIVINELLAHSHNSADWVELHNTTAQPVDIGGWFLSDDGNDSTKYEIAAGTTIPANGYLVLYEHVHFGNPLDPGAHSPFALSENGETLYLRSLDTGYATMESFGATERDISLGRYLKSTGTINFVAMLDKTPGAANAAPRVGPLVITECMYNPQSADQKEEYVELHNLTGAPVPLFDDDNNTWRFTDGIAFAFPAGIMIPANGYILIVKDPTTFAATYPDVPDDVQVFGPYIGNLSDAGEKLEISKPGDVDDAGIRQYIRIDRVNYEDTAPWPVLCDGHGMALNRVTPALYGNDPVNWEDSSPTPGE